MEVPSDAGRSPVISGHATPPFNNSGISPATWFAAIQSNRLKTRRKEVAGGFLVKASMTRETRRLPSHANSMNAPMTSGPRPRP
jgi:hypothetical protein